MFDYDTPGYCTECEAPIDAADAHICKACIAEDDYHTEMARFDSDIDAYIDSLSDTEEN